MAIFQDLANVAPGTAQAISPVFPLPFPIKVLSNYAAVVNQQRRKAEYGRKLLPIWRVFHSLTSCTKIRLKNKSFRIGCQQKHRITFVFLFGYGNFFIPCSLLQTLLQGFSLGKSCSTKSGESYSTKMVIGSRVTRATEHFQ